MRNIALILILAVAALGLGWLLTPSLERGRQEVQEAIPAVEAQGQTELALDQLQHFEGMPVFGLGEEYQGLQMVKMQYVRDLGPPGIGRPAVEYVCLIYASCKPGHPAGGGSAEGYCAEGEEPTFVQVLTEQFCLNPPSLLAAGARQGPPFKVGQALAQQTVSGELHLYMGQSTVIISTSEGGEMAEVVARDLKAVNALAHVPLGPPIHEEDCEGFVLPDPVPMPTAAPAAIPTSEETQ